MLLKQYELKQNNEIQKRLTKKPLKGYHLSMMGFDRTYVPPTVRDNERKHIF